jgi:hypothetical protein
MGDLRNRIRKMEEAERIRRMQEHLCPPTPERPLPRCLCGLTWLETKMVSHQDGPVFLPPMFPAPPLKKSGLAALCAICTP